MKLRDHKRISLPHYTIKDAIRFAEYANQASKVKIEYLDKYQVVTNDNSDAVEIKENLKLHHVGQNHL